MEIRIILDDRIVHGAKRLFSRRSLAVLAGLTLLAGTAHVVAQGAGGPANFFTSGTVISSSDVNQNFQDLHDIATAQDEEIATKVSGIEFTNYIFNYNDKNTAEETLVVTHDYCAPSTIVMNGVGIGTFLFEAVKHPTIPGQWTLKHNVGSGGTGTPWSQPKFLCFDFVG